MRREQGGGEDWLLVPATISYLWLLCISALVEATTPHFTHLMAALSWPLPHPKSWIDLWSALPVSSKETSCDSLLRGSVTKGDFHLERYCRCQHGGIASFLKCKIFLFKGRWETRENQVLFYFRKKKKVSIDYAFPSTLVTLRWFWRPGSGLSSMFCFLPVRGSLLSCLPHSSWQSTMRVLGSEWKDLNPSHTS